MNSQTLDLKSFDLISLESSETLSINGGATDFAYDVGTFLRYSFFCVTNNLAGKIETAYKWAKANDLHK